jgi:hypothetical protein
LTIGFFCFESEAGKVASINQSSDWTGVLPARGQELLCEAKCHPFRNSEVLPLFVCSTDCYQITIEPESSGLVLSLPQCR